MTRSSPLQQLRQLSYPAGHLYCMHHAGGGATSFRTWEPLLRRDLAVTATMLPGRERRFGEPHHRLLDDAADEVAAAIGAAWTSAAPTILFGHSLGGLLAYEVCRRLENEGLRPARLIVSGVVPVRRPSQLRHTWSDAALVDLMKELGGTPPEVFEHEDLMQLCLAILRADLRLVDTYEADGRPPIATDLTAIGGAADRVLSHGGLEPWSELTTGAFEAQMFSGGHFFLEDHRDDVIRWIETHLAQSGALPKR